MNSYRKELEDGMRAVKEYTAARLPPSTRLEWRPMDGAGNYPLQATIGRNCRILFRLSKSSLARCSREFEGWQDVRMLVEDSVRLAG
ncbi:MAG: hypothetical protein ACO1SX_09895 [Actinomycetota bacterium]